VKKRYKKQRVIADYKTPGTTSSPKWDDTQHAFTLLVVEMVMKIL
jgi:hypothetical protein